MSVLRHNDGPGKLIRPASAPGLSFDLPFNGAPEGPLSRFHSASARNKVFRWFQNGVLGRTAKVLALKLMEQTNGEW